MGLASGVTTSYTSAVSIGRLKGLGGGRRREIRHARRVSVGYGRGRESRQTFTGLIYSEWFDLEASETALFLALVQAVRRSGLRSRWSARVGCFCQVSHELTKLTGGAEYADGSDHFGWVSVRYELFLGVWLDVPFRTLQYMKSQDGDSFHARGERKRRISCFRLAFL